MTFTVSDFPRFFAAVNGGHRPFPWQMRLIDSIITEGRWPAAITAPTGSGKSAVVETHIFLTALNAVGAAPRLPRRLCVVVDRRALVDSQADRAARVLSWWRPLRMPWPRRWQVLFAPFHSARIPLRSYWPTCAAESPLTDAGSMILAPAP